YLGGPLPLRNEHKEQRLIDELNTRLAMRIGYAERFSGLSAVQTAERLRGFGEGRVEGSGLDACFVTSALEPELRLDGASFELGLRSQDETGAVRHASAEAVLRAFRRGESLVPLVEGGWAALPQGFLERSGHVIADLVAAKAEHDELPKSALPDL